MEELTPQSLPALTLSFPPALPLPSFLFNPFSSLPFINEDLVYKAGKNFESLNACCAT
jgi:hypothetical protein